MFKYTNKSLLRDDKIVMHEWEHPIMFKHAEVVTKNGGDILELGFGMGISADYIQKQNINSHTIIENNEVVFEKLKEWAEDKPNVKIIFGDWKSNLPDMKFDGILKDTYDDKLGAVMFPHMILKVCKVNTIVSFFNDTLHPQTIYQGMGEFPKFLEDSIVNFYSVGIEPPEEVDYLGGDGNVYYTPEWIVSENDTKESFDEKLKRK